MENREFNDELLSAYLDGELPAEERAAVETRLEQDADARELVRELRATAQAVRDLPKLTAPSSLKAEILRAAAQECDRHCPGGSAEAEAAPAILGPSWQRIGSPRRWLWAGLAVAAAVMIMFLNGEPQEDVDIARQAPRREEPSRAVDRALRRAPEISMRGVEEGRRDEQTLQADDSLPSLLPEEPEARGREETSRSLTEEVPQSPDVPQQRGFAAYDNLFMDGTLTESDSEAGVPRPKEANVVLHNAGAAFAADGEAPQQDAPPVYFVSVNVRPDAVRNNTITNYFGQNSFRLLNELSLTEVEDQERQDEGETIVAESTLSAPPTAGLARARAAGPSDWAAAEEQSPPRAESNYVVAVEGPPEQVSALLNDLAVDRQNVTAVAVLSEPNRPATPPLAEPTKFNRNAQEAVNQVEGSWFFKTSPSQFADTRETQIQEHMAADGAAAYGGYGGGYGRGYGGGVGGGYRYGGRAPNAPAAGAARAGGYGDNRQERSRLSQTLPADAAQDAYQLADDEKATQPLAQAPEADSRSDFASARPSLGTSSAEGAPPEPLSESRARIVEVDASLGRLAKQGAAGAQAWVVSPLKRRALAPAERDRPEEQAQRFGLESLADGDSDRAFTLPSTASGGGQQAQLGLARGAAGPANQVRVLMFFNVLPEDLPTAAAPVPPAAAAPTSAE